MPYKASDYALARRTHNYEQKEFNKYAARLVRNYDEHIFREPKLFRTILTPGRNQQTPQEQLWRYLFEEYQVPQWLRKHVCHQTQGYWDGVVEFNKWFKAAEGSYTRRTRPTLVKLYLALARGYSPAKWAHANDYLTKREMKFLFHPKTESATEAIVQMKVLAAFQKFSGSVDSRFVSSMMNSQLPNTLRDSTLQEINKVIDFLVKVRVSNGNDIVGNIGYLLDYITAQIRDNAGWTIAGRNIQRVTELANEWHTEMSESRGGSTHSWLASNMSRTSVKFPHWMRLLSEHADDIYVETTELAEFVNNEWEIIEITNGQRLSQEGRELRHCVGSYSHSCAAGRSRIFAIDKLINGKPSFNSKNRLTLEVRCENDTVVQVKGNLNRNPTFVEWLMIHVWMMRVNLTPGQGIRYQDYGQASNMFATLHQQARAIPEILEDFEDKED